METNGLQCRIFQERTNFNTRLGQCTEDSIPLGATPKQEKTAAKALRRKKSQQNMLSTSLPSFPNYWARPPPKVLQPAVEVSGASKDDTVTRYVAPASTHPQHVASQTTSSSPQPLEAQAAQCAPDIQPARLQSTIPRSSSTTRLPSLSLDPTYDEAEAQHKLKVDALTRVTASLAAKASESKEGVERLRKLLADRAEVDPRVYKAAQRERWLEERRQLETEALLQTVQVHLSSLVNNPSASSLPPLSDHGTVGSVATTAPGRVVARAPAAANLRMFLTAPQRHASGRRRRPPPLPEDAFARIRHHKQLLPLRLKAPVVPPFAQPRTVKQTLPQTQTHITQIEPIGSVVDALSLDTSALGDSSVSPATLTTPTNAPSSAVALTPTLAVIPESIEDAYPTHEDSSPNPSPTLRPKPDGTSTPTGDGEEGTVTIWRAVPRTREEILADLAANADTSTGTGTGTGTSVPDYVGDLLAELDASAVARVRLNSLRRSASFPRRPVSAKATTARPKNTASGGIASTNATTGPGAAGSSSTPRATRAAKRSTMISASTPVSPEMSSRRTSLAAASPSASSPSASSPSASSPSRRRLSALFSLPDMRSSRRSLHIPHTSPTAHADRPHTSAQLPALTLTSPSIQFTILESAHEEEAEQGEGEELLEHSLGTLAPIPSSTSATTLSSVGTVLRDGTSSLGALGINMPGTSITGGDATNDLGTQAPAPASRAAVVPVPAHVAAGPGTDDKILARIRRRMSAALGR